MLHKEVQLAIFGLSLLAFIGFGLYGGGTIFVGLKARSDLHNLQRKTQ